MIPCQHAPANGTRKRGFTGNGFTDPRSGPDGCGCPCDFCRPYLTSAEVATLSAQLDRMANGLFVAAMMFLTVEVLR